MTADRPRKIFFVLGSFKLGGTERTASRIGLELLRRGYPVKFLLVNGVFDYNDEQLVSNSVILGKHQSSGILKLLMVYIRLLRIVWKEKPHRLISFSLGINMLIFFLFYPRSVFRIESNIFIFKKKLYRRYLQDFFSRFAHIIQVIIPSRGLYDASRNYFRKNHKLTLISNPLDIENIELVMEEPISDFPDMLSSPFILSAGRLNASKGFEQLIQVYRKSKLYPSMKLVILGDGPLYKKLKEQITNEQLGGHVILAGYQQNPYRFMTKAKFFILNSRHESFGNVLIEAFACNIPVMSNDCDFGPRHIITHDVNGFLFDQNNEREFIEKLELLAFNHEIYNRNKTGAIASKAVYHVKTITEQWISEVIEKKL